MKKFKKKNEDVWKITREDGKTVIFKSDGKKKIKENVKFKK